MVKQKIVLKQCIENPTDSKITYVGLDGIGSSDKIQDVTLSNHTS